MYEIRLCVLEEVFTCVLIEASQLIPEEVLTHAYWSNWTPGEKMHKENVEMSFFLQLHHKIKVQLKNMGISSEQTLLKSLPQM